MPISMMLMLDALGYCTIDDDAVWPPSGAIPPEVELTVTAMRPPGALSVRTSDGARVPLEAVRQVNGGQWVYRPSRPLPPGPARLLGPIAASWEVVEGARSAPAWTNRALQFTVAGYGFLCPQGPFVDAVVPLVGDERLPLAEITTSLPTGEVFRARFALDDGSAKLHDGCAPALPFPEGTYALWLEIAGVDEIGRRTPVRRVQVVHVQPVANP